MFSFTRHSLVKAWSPRNADSTCDMSSEPLPDLGSSCSLYKNKGEVISQPEAGCYGHLFFLSCPPPRCTCKESSGVPESAVPAIMGGRPCAVCPVFLTGLNMLAKHQDVFVTSSLGFETWTLFTSRYDTHFAQAAFLWHPVALQAGFQEGEEKDDKGSCEPD